MKNGLHHWTEDSKIHNLDLNFAFIGFSYIKICIFKVQLSKFKNPEK